MILVSGSLVRRKGLSFHTNYDSYANIQRRIRGNVDCSFHPSYFLSISLLSELTLDANEFESITSAIINKLREEELGVQTSENQQQVSFLITKDNLVTWYIEHCIPGIEEQTEESNLREYRKIERVIDRMITHDMSLIVSGARSGMTLCVCCL